MSKKKNVTNLWPINGLGEKKEGEKEGEGKRGEKRENTKSPIEIKMSRKELLFNNLHVSSDF